MTLKQIPLDEISFENEAYRISENLDHAPVLHSIREIGQLNPVILLDLQPKRIIVCGFRRMHALRRLGNLEVFARLLSSEDYDHARAFLLALWDNLSHRQLSALEKAGVLYKLRNLCGVPDEMLVGAFLPALGLAPNANVLRSHLLMNQLHPDLRRCFGEEKLTQSSIERLAEMPAQIQSSIASLMTGIRWSASIQKKALHVLDELSASSGSQFEAPLKSPQVLAILEDGSLSSFQKGEKIYDFLYRLQNPMLSQAEDRFIAKKKQLALPGSIRIEPHPYFEEPGLSASFQAPSLESFRQLASALNDAARSPEMERLFDLD